MSDIEKKVAAAKADIATAQAARARAEHQYKVAQAQAEAAARDLKEEFGATSPQEARELIASKEAELEAECSRVREALSRSRAGDGDGGEAAHEADRDGFESHGVSGYEL